MIDRIGDPAVRRYLARRWNWLGAGTAVVMIAVAWPVMADVTEIPGFALPAFAVGGCGGLALIFAGPVPVRYGWAATVITAGVASVIGTVDLWRMPIPLFLSVLAMTAAALCTQPLRRLPTVVVATAGVFVLGVDAQARIGWIFALIVVAMAIAFVRYRTTTQRDLAEQSEETEVLRAREAVLAERTRIARDLHDIVAHRMSMVVVMAQSAPYRLAAADEPETVGPATTAEFDAIAAAARGSLDEVRQLLGVLRPDAAGTDAAALRPVQGLDDIAPLLDGVRAVGTAVETTDTVDHARVAEAIGAAVFRIVQESVTNATRHAPGATIRVSITPDATHDGLLAVEVANGPPDADPVSAGGGLGILGMTERALAVGGTLTAAPTGDGGFAVRARLPMALS